jgi:sporulation protein YlmC with PRC-barrel domain
MTKEGRIIMMNNKVKKSDMVGLVVAFVLAGGSLAFALDNHPRSGGSQSHASEEILLNANTLIGNTVVDKSGKELGTVKDLSIDQSTGKISYIILSYGGTFGGTLGIGAENYSIPWNEVKLTKQDGKMMVQVADVAIGETTKPSDHASIQHQKNAGTHTMGFNAATVATLEGTVENVDNDMLEPGVAMTDSLVVLDVKTSSGKERVRVAPDNYLKQQGIEIKEGDKVEVTGSRINQDGEDLVLASKITLMRNGKVLALRQDDGTPKWKPEREIRAKSKANN